MRCFPMLIRLLAITAVAVASSAIAVSCASAQSRKTRDTLVIDHAKPNASYGKPTVKNGARIRSKRRVVDVVVKNSNSAFYDCKVSSTATSTPEVDATLGFLKGLGPYLVEAAIARAAVTPRILKSDPTLMTGDQRSVADELAIIDSALFAPDGLHAILARTLLELNRMRSGPVDHPSLTLYKNEMLTVCVLIESKCVSLHHTQTLASALTRLAKIYRPFAQAVKAKTNPSVTETELVEKGAAALADADGLLESAYVVERMVQRTYTAAPTFGCSEEIKMSHFSGRDATIAVSSTGISGIARVVTAEPYTLKVNVTSDWWIRPTLGLAFVAVPDGEFPKFGVKTVNDTTHTIRTAGSTDARFTYGLVLATTWRLLDARDTKYRFAVYLPELTVNPSDDVKAAAIGLGFSISKVKFGFGYAVTKHSILTNGQSLGTIVRDPEEISTRDGYGKRKFYWSVSLIGLPPFLPQ